MYIGANKVMFAVHDTNEERAYEAGREQGKQEEYDRFWDSYQINGTQTNYKYKFSYSGWNDTCFNPKYPLVCEENGGDCIFIYNQQITDTTKVPITLATSANQTFNWCTNLKKTHIIVNKDTKFSNTFGGCTSLEELYVDGVIGQNGFDVSVCPLTYDSLASIAYALEDKYQYGDVSTGQWVIRIGSANYGKLDNGLIQTMEGRGWTIE